MIPKGTSHTSVPNSTYEVPKGTMKTRFEPSLPRMSARKNSKLHTQNSNPEPPASVISNLTLDHQSQKQSVPTKRFMWRSQLREQICQISKSDRQEWQSFVVLSGTNIDYGNLWRLALMVQWQNTCSWCRGSEFISRVWSLIFFHDDILGSLYEFKSGFHNSFWDLVVPDRIWWMTLEIIKWNLGTSFD